MKRQINNNIFLSYILNVSLKNYLVFFLISITSFSSCNYFKNSSNSANQNVKDSVIKTEVMIDLLTDIYLIEAALKLKQLQSKDSKSFSNIYYSMLLNKYDVTMLDIKVSLDYYMKNTSEFEYIYSEIMNSMTQIQSLVLSSQSTSQSFAGMSLRNKLKRLTNDTL